MFRSKKLLSLILAAVMLLSTVLVSSAEAGTENTSTMIVFEAEDGVIKNDKVKVVGAAGFEEAQGMAKDYTQPEGKYYFDYNGLTNWASGNEYLMLNTDTYLTANYITSREAITEPEVTYNVNIPKAGTYYIWVRVGSPLMKYDTGDYSKKANAMWLGTDASAYQALTDYQFADDSSPEFNWKMHTVKFSEAGEHAIYLVHYKTRTFVDQILITDDSDYVPSGKLTSNYDPSNSGEEKVASIDGKDYATLEEALKNVEAGKTVKLEADATLPSVYDKEITYDLNGHILTGNAFTGINATVVDSSNGNGLLKVPQNGLALDSNNDGYMPVWDNSTNAGYRFAKVTIEDRSVDATGSSLVFSMRPSFGSDAIGQLVAAGYETGMVRVGVRITWTDPATNTTKTQDFALEDSWLSEMYGTPSKPKGVKFTISGGETITNFTATTIVWSNLSTCPNVEIAGETHEYPAKVE